MQQYFSLQFLMLNRKIREFGIAPVYAWLLMPPLFVVFSVVLFEKTNYAPILFAAIALILAGRLTDPPKSDFLVLIYGERKTMQIRISENIAIVIPFIIVLLIRQEWTTAAVLLVLAILLALPKGKATLTITFPTPFTRTPFEFTSGFRSSFLMFPLAYSLAIIAVAVDNFNLGIFSLILVFLVTYGFYLKPEPGYFVWIFSCSPAVFLYRKSRTALFNVSLLSAPMLILLGGAYPDRLPVIALFLALGLLFLFAVILAKYAAYPMEINLPEFLILTLGMIFLPAMLLVIPYFYIKALKKLRDILV